MRISHRELAICKRDPASWVAQKVNPPGNGPRAGYNAYLKNGIRRLHKGATLEEATAAMAAGLERNRNLTSPSRIQDVIDQLASYHAWYVQEQPVVADSFFNIQFEATRFLTLTGQLGRVDITETGHRGILLGPYDDGWSEELRMPLLQAALNERYGLSGSDTSIGVQRLDGSGLKMRSYSEREVTSAVREFARLAQTVEVAYRRYVPSGG
jgi:hypothetical protein